MKILIIIEDKSSIRARKEINTFRRAGHIVHVVGPGIYSQAVNHQVTMPELIRKSQIASLCLPIYFNWWRRHLRRILKRNRFDWLFVHNLQLVKVALEMQYKYGGKIAIDLRENYPALLRESRHTKMLLAKLFYSDRKWIWYEHKYLPLTDRVITTCREMRDRIGFGEVVPNYFHLDFGPRKEYVLVYVGGLYYPRGLDIVLRAMPLMPDAHLWIIGEGSYRRHLERRATKNVTFFGWKGNAHELIRRADIGIIPNFKSEQADNSSPNKLYEYAYAGLPVLVSNCNSIARMVKLMQNGLVYQHDSPEDLARQFFNLTQMNHKKMGFAGRWKVLSEYHWQGERFLEIFEK